MTRLRQVQPLLAAVDCGTSTVKAAIFDCRGRRVAMAARPCPPDPGPQGAVEQDPARLEDAARCALREATRACGARVRSVVALAVTGQRATVFFLDRRGAPLGPGLNWQDLRGAPAVAQFAARFGAGRFAELTGLPCHAVFTIGKLLDLAGREPGRFRHIRHLALVNDYLLSRLAGKAAMPADWSSASLTGLLATGGFQWALPILAAVGLPRAALPDLAPPGRPVGVLSSAAARATGLPAGLPLVTGAGDHQCAGLGAGAIAPGSV